MTKDEAIQLIRDIEKEVNQIIIGQSQMVRHLLVGLLTEIAYSFKKSDWMLTHHF